jgi:hypothetical protein
MTESEPVMNLKFNQYDFVHFATQIDCEIHIKNNKHIQIAYLCCGGKGFARFRKNTIYTLNAVKTHPYIPIQGNCEICFEEGVSLFKTCDTCSQPFCKPCLDKITSKVCPYCRGKLNNNF